MSSGRKIVRLFSRLNVGGPALHVVNLSKGMREHGYETVLAVGFPDATEGSMENYAHEQGVEFARIFGFQAAISPFKDLWAAIEIFRLIRKQKPLIVHTHTFKAGLLGRIAARLAGVPFVVHTYHGHLLRGYWGGWKSKVIVRLEKWLGMWTDRVVAVSPKVAQDLIAAGVVPQNKVSVVGLGFDVERFLLESQRPSGLRRRLGIGADATVIAIVGRLVAVKNVDLFLQALCPLTCKYPNLHLAIVGDGVERDRLERSANRLCPTPAHRNRIHFTGFVMPMEPEWKDIDLCLCTSRNEGTSVSIIEAIMAGVPVISTAVGGMPDLLENGRWGDLVPESAQVIRDRVDRWLEARPKPAPDAAETFRRRFSDSRLTAETESLYAQMLEDRP